MQSRNLFRHKLLVTAMTVACAAGTLAQQAPQNIEEIQITGSRIRNTGTMTTPTPVTAISQDELKDFNPGSTVAEELDALPQFFATPTAQRGGLAISNNAGGSYLNLRGLGQNRTLILLDGARIMPSDVNGSANIDNFPNALVKRTDIITGGASAAYGADAVAGVVNFVLDREYEGLKMSVSAGTSEQGIGDNYNFSAAGGTSLLDKKLHLIGSVEARHIDQIDANPNIVSNWKDYGLVQNPAWVSATATPNIPRRITVPYVFPNTASPQGLIIGAGNFSPTGRVFGVGSDPAVATSTFSLSNYTFTDDGKGVRPYSFGQYSSTVFNNQSGGNEYNTWKAATDTGPDGFGVEQRSGFLGAKYDVNDNFSVRGQVSIGRTESSYIERRRGFLIPGRIAGGSPPSYVLQLFKDNPFLPKAVKDAMTAEGKDFIFVEKQGLVLVPGQKNLYENGGDKSVSQLLSGTVGFDWNIDDNWNLTGNFQKGKSKIHTGYINVPRLDKFYLALDTVTDASGKNVCNIAKVNPSAAQLQASVAGQKLPSPIDVRGVTVNSPVGPLTPAECQPLNYLGIAQTSQATIDWMTEAQKFNLRDFNQSFAELLLTGQIHEGWGAGPVSVAAGLTWRDEDFRVWNEPAYGERGLINVPSLGIRGIGAGPAGQGNRSLAPFSSLGVGSGDNTVKEIYGELNIPVWKWASGQSIDTNIAYRSSDYAVAGREGSWKWGVNAQVFKDLRWRLTRSQDVREPNFFERYLTGTGGASVNDPEFGNTPNTSLSSYANPNPNLAVEKAKTVTTGFVYQPSFAPWVDGVQIALDWYQITLAGAIAPYGLQRLVDDCYNTKKPEICVYVERDPVSRIIQRVLNVNVNAGSRQVRGTDLEVQYKTDLDFFAGQEESLSVRFLAGYLAENSTTSAVGTYLDNAGFGGAGVELPNYSATLATNYTVGNYSARVGVNYYGHTWNDARSAGAPGTGKNVAWVEGVDVDNMKIASQTVVNMALSYGRPMESGGNWKVTLNINNLLNRDPPIIAASTGQSISNSHDQFGRRYQLSYNMEF